MDFQALISRSRFCAAPRLWSWIISGNRHLLIEFKRPSIAVGRDAEAQANKYADILTGKRGIVLEILIVGGEVDSRLQHEYSGKQTRFYSYRAIIANARNQLEWLP